MATSQARPMIGTTNQTTSGTNVRWGFTSAMPQAR